MRVTKPEAGQDEGTRLPLDGCLFCKTNEVSWSMPPLTPTESAAWRGFLSAHSRLWQHLDADMQAEYGFGLPVYELLLTLEERGELRMTDLAAALRYSSGGLTRLADKLEAQGLIQRVRSETDGRGFQVSLTAAGKAKLKRVHVFHLKGVRELFLSRLNEEEQQMLGQLWAKLGGTQ